MAKPNDGRVVRLTKRAVDAAAPEGDRFYLWDDALKGFGLRVEPTGLKTFVVRYRVGGGRRGTRRQYKIGTYGKLTPDQARDLARSALAQVEMGQDPQGERADARQTLTVAELCDRYLIDGVAHKKASTLVADRIRIERHIKPLIGRRKITAIERSDVDQLVSDIAGGKVKLGTPHTRGGPGAAARTAGLLSGIYTFAVERKLCTENPAKGVRRPADQRRDRFLSPAELARLGEVLTAAEAKGAHPFHVAIIRLLCLSGARKNEIARLKRAEVEIDRKRLKLADSKTGAKVIPLGAPALEILSTIEATDSPYVFPDPKFADEPIRNLDWFWVGIRNAAGMPDVRIHDLRHSFASVAVAGGETLFLIGKLLGHAHASTTNRYAHLADDPLSAAADKIAATIGAQMAGGGGDAIPIRGTGK